MRYILLLGAAALLLGSSAWSRPAARAASAVPDPDRMEQGRLEPARMADGGYGVRGGYDPYAIVINDHVLTPQERAQLGGVVPPGAYWYDSVAGFWGHVGGPVEGQNPPGFVIGRMRPDVSNGDTGTFINGRELTRIEVAWLNQQVPVQRGYFWMNAQGVFGYIGGGPLGRIALGGGGGGGARRPSLSERGMLFRPGEILNGQ